MAEHNDPHDRWDDPIVAEVRAARQALFAEAGYDLEELGRQLRTRQAAAGHEVITLPPRPPQGSRDQAA